MSKNIFKGFIYVLSSSILLKVLGLISQIVLARNLSKEDFGYIGSAGFIAAFTGVVQYFGIKEFLVFRGRNINLWLADALGFSLVVGSVGLVSSIIWWVFMWSNGHSAVLPMLVVIYTTAFCIGSFGGIYASIDQVRQNYGRLAKGAALLGTANSMGSVSFALLGLQYLTVPIAMVVANVARTLYFAVNIQSQYRFVLRPRRWRYFAGSGGYLAGASLSGIVINQCGTIALIAIVGARASGDFYFSFGISMQALQLLTANITQVLFPALSNISVCKKNKAVLFQKWVTYISFLGILSGIVQCALLPIIIPTVFGEKWESAITSTQILTLVAILQGCSLAYGAQLQALGKWKELFVCSLGNAAVSAIVVSCGGYLRGLEGACEGLLMVSVPAVWFNLWYAVKLSGSATRWVHILMTKVIIVIVLWLLVFLAWSSKNEFGPGIDISLNLSLIVLSLVMFRREVKRAKGRFFGHKNFHA